MSDFERKNTDLEYINKIYNYIKNGMSVEDFMCKFKCNLNELKGILELCKIYGKNVDIVSKNGNIYFVKQLPKAIHMNKMNFDSDKLIHTEICVVSDTHFGNIHQQLHLLNEIYLEAYNRGITTVLHCGDMVDGNYLNRPEQPRQQFLH